MTHNALTTETIDRAIRQVASSLASPKTGGFSIDDLSQIAWEALLSKGMPSDIRLIATIAKRRMIDAIRGDSIRRGLSLDAKIGGADSDGTATFLDRLAATPVETYSEDPRLTLVMDFIGTLTDARELDLFRYCKKFGAPKEDQKSIEEIGRMHGVGKQRMSQISKALWKRLVAYCQR